MECLKVEMLEKRRVELKDYLKGAKAVVQKAQKRAEKMALQMDEQKADLRGD